MIYSTLRSTRLDETISESEFQTELNSRGPRVEPARPKPPLARLFSDAAAGNAGVCPLKLTKLKTLNISAGL